MPFVPHTEDDIQQMLAVIGIEDIDTLFDEIPSALRCGELAVPVAMNEMEIRRHMHSVVAKDRSMLNFIGAGAYEHHIPSAVWQIAARGEFYTAYTPYQAEASQGTLQVIYEYQSMMAALMAMDISNASLYDGASALAEAVLMAVRLNKKSKSRKVLLPETIHPAYRATTAAIVHNQGIELISVPVNTKTGQTDIDSLDAWVGEDITALVIPQPNYFGILEDVDAMAEWAEAQNLITIGVVNPVAIALLKPPGEWGGQGVDIACGEGQPLGAPLSSGGPYYGFLCCKKKHVRQMPGRLIGRTIDADGKSGFVLTLQAREQHIRRSKATSNICTNQGLVVTASVIHMALLGESGLKKVASRCFANTHALVEQLAKLDVKPVFSGEYFHEVLLELPIPSEKQDTETVLGSMSERGISGGISISADYPTLKKAILVCATETKTMEDLDLYTSALGSILADD